MKVDKKVYATCLTCNKEISFVPSRRQKYCSTDCYVNNPDNKTKRRKALSHFFKR